MKKIGITFIIPHRESDSITDTVNKIKECATLNKLPFEIIAATGNNPTYQRNCCIKQAKYSYIYFIDNDTRVMAESLLNVVSVLSKDKDIVVLGGPAVTPADNSYLQKNFGAIFSSSLAVGKIASRYSRRGALRETDDSELILCNMIVKKNVFDKVGLFNENLYPNEENEFIHRVLSKGLKVVYAPGVFVEKDQRSTLLQFIRQLLTYGRGRGEQTRIKPKSFNLALLIPISLIIYFVLLFLLAIPFFKFVPFGVLFNKIALIPLLFYFIFSLFSFVVSIFQFKKIFIYFPIFFFFNHFFYVIGFFNGLLKKGFKSQKKKSVCTISRQK